MIENDYTESDYYVSFDAVFRAIDEYDDYVIDDETGEWYIPISKALSLIENIPPADVRPVVRGKWEWNEHYGLYECSNCHNSFVDEEWVKEGKWQYCPSCGACMENIHND